jgi:branched-chain amino acid transport system substrate-binding protein
MIMPRGRKTILMLASIAGVVALAAAGCSSSSKSSSGTTATTAAPATSASTSPAGSTGATTGSTGSTAGGTADGVGEPLSTPTGTPFNLGYICLCGQLNANATLNPAVLRAWVTWQNLHGGVNGHPVHLSYFNDPGNPGVALLQVQKMVNSDHIVALIDGDSADDASWYSYIIKQPVTIYNTGFSSLPMASSTSPNVFEMAVSQYYLFDEIMLSAQKVGGHKMAVLYCAENPACKETVAPLTAAGKQFNIPVVFNASVLASAPNYTAQCLAAKQAGADVMFIADGGAVTVSVAASCATQGYTPHQVSDEGAYNQSFAGKAGWDGFLGSQDVIPFFVTSTPGSKLMQDTIAQYAPGVLTNAQWNVTNEFPWTLGLLINQAAKAGGVGTTQPLTGTALTNAMYQLHTTTLNGMTPTLTFTRGQVNQPHCWFWAGIKNGKWYLPYGLTTTCAATNPTS